MNVHNMFNASTLSQWFYKATGLCISDTIDSPAKISAKSLNELAFLIRYAEKQLSATSYPDTPADSAAPLSDNQPVKENPHD